MGLALGATYLTAGMGAQVADREHAVRMADAVQAGYAGTDIEGRAGLGLVRDSFGRDAETMAARFKSGRGAARAVRAADLECLTQAVYYEARSESPRGQAAVAQVVMNRVRHPAYPKSVCGVVYQGARAPGCQFSFACDGSMRRGRESAAWAEARKVAARTLAGVIVANVGAATHYHTTAVSPAWAPRMARVAQVGVHIFYRFAPRRAQAYHQARGLEGRAILTSAPAASVQALSISPTLVEAAVEASLEAPKTPEAKPSAAPEPAQAVEAATLASPRAVSEGAS